VLITVFRVSVKVRMKRPKRVSRTEKYIQDFGRETRRKDTTINLTVNEWRPVILKWTLRKEDGGVDWIHMAQTMD
jgi:hypothetical protein